MSIMDNNTMKKLGDFVNENLPHILTGVASIGVITTSVEAAKAAVKVKELDNDTADARKASEKSKTFIKTWIPTIISGALTIGCIVSSDVIHTKRYAGMLGAYLAAKTELPKYKQKVEELVGKEKAKEIGDKAKEDMTPVALKGVDRAAALNKTMKYKVIDQVTGFEFEASIAALLRGETAVAKEVARTGHAYLEQFYDEVTNNADTPEVAGRIYWSNDGTGYYDKDMMNLIISAEVDPDGEVYLTIDYEYSTK